MFKHKIGLAALGLSAIGMVVLAAAGLSGQGPTSGRPTVQMTVSAEARHGTEVPAVRQDDVMINEGRDRDPVVSWIPAQGEHAGLELLVVIDDAVSLNLGIQLDDLRAFMREQPSTTLIGVGYMRFGMVGMLQDFTQDHAAAGKALRIPMGGMSPSPYFSLQDLMKHWPSNMARPRHEILMISDGIDANYPGGPLDPYVDEAINDLQRAAVVVYSIYEPGAVHLGHSFWRLNWGQNNLARVSEETGGECYYLGLGPAVAYFPYLDELTHQLQHQYLLTFTPKPQKQAGLQGVRVSTELSGVDLVAADKVYVPASRE
jgi:hypothetical protein